MFRSRNTVPRMDAMAENEQKWEYKFVAARAAGLTVVEVTGESATEETLEAVVNRLAKEGWEYAGMTAVPMTEQVIVTLRRIFRDAGGRRPVGFGPSQRPQ